MFKKLIKIIAILIIADNLFSLYEIFTSSNYSVFIKILLTLFRTGAILSISYYFLINKKNDKLFFSQFK